ncbi:hypothetical protein DM02DRAFT_600523 [Periconia macrospinosa]|uniref:CENP-V/GFA domain-containing protein n=1 Tax=Periconia macrospinosa TaxID=97972 RepID=A0A2V1DBZ1_9PLEO|nr:hypothetical protein DM02DRAFT_600523 [Periconia macrospinosa]
MGSTPPSQQQHQPPSQSTSIETKTQTFNARCHCTSQPRISFTVPTSDLPLPAYFCHCGVCRRTHGTLADNHVKAAEVTGVDVEDGEDEEGLKIRGMKAYRSSVGYFCQTCGAHVFDRTQGEIWYYISISSIDAPESVWDIHSHYHVGSIGDGGMANWIRSIDGRREVRALQTQQQQRRQQEQEGEEDKKHDFIKAQCHCKGVTFYILRPPPPSSSAEPKPDDDEDSMSIMPASLTPRDPTKWYALLDMCTTCSLVSACAVVAWCFPLASRILIPAWRTWQPLTSLFGTLKQYTSSNGIRRTFCGACGAVVSYECEDRAGIVDVAVGILRGEEEEEEWVGRDRRGKGKRDGALALSWLEWRTGKVGFREDAIERGWGDLFGGLEEGLMAWGKKVG